MTCQLIELYQLPGVDHDRMCVCVFIFVCLDITDHIQIKIKRIANKTKQQKK